jgi:hypothetical protein
MDWPDLLLPLNLLLHLQLQMVLFQKKKILNFKNLQLRAFNRFLAGLP